MSDPVTNVEIEDVLSSIRKLVAEEVRATPIMRKPEKPGRLILTAAHRVKEDVQDAERPSEPVLLTQPILPSTTWDAERSIDDIPRDARLADFGEVEGAFPDIDTFSPPESSDDTAYHADEQEEAEHHSDDARASEEDWQPDEEEDWHPSDDAQQDESSVAERDELSRLIDEEVSAALGLTDNDDFEDEGHTSARADDAHRTTESSGDWQSEDESESADEDDYEASVPSDGEAYQSEGDDDEAEDVTVEETNWHDDEEIAAESVEAEPQPIPAPPQTLEDKVAALGRLVARGTQDFEEERDRPDADELSAISEPMTWPEAPYEDAMDEAVVEESNVLHAEDAWPQSQAYQTPVAEEVAAPTAVVQTFAQDDTPALEIDEETLRQMVVDIVRQELQGALGERITRNVRKLVRREIHRMLISQDFD